MYHAMTISKYVQSLVVFVYCKYPHNIFDQMLRVIVMVKIAGFIRCILQLKIEMYTGCWDEVTFGFGALVREALDKTTTHHFLNTLSLCGDHSCMIPGFVKGLYSNGDNNFLFIWLSFPVYVILDPFATQPQPSHLSLSLVKTPTLLPTPTVLTK